MPNDGQRVYVLGYFDFVVGETAYVKAVHGIGVWHGRIALKGLPRTTMQLVAAHATGLEIHGAICTVGDLRPIPDSDPAVRTLVETLREATEAGSSPDRAVTLAQIDEIENDALVLHGCTDIGPDPWLWEALFESNANDG